MADNKTRKRSRYVFHAQSRESVRKHIQYAGFRETMLKAYGGELEPLHGYLRTFLREHADEIAEFLKRRLRRARYLIKDPPTPEREAEDRIIRIVLYRLKYVGQRLGHPLPRGEYQRQIDQAWDDLGENDNLFNADHALINNERILKAIRRGKKRTVVDNKPRRRSQYVHHPQSRESVQSIQNAGFRKTMRQAYGGNLEPLHEYLRAYLGKDHADTIIKWAKPRLRQDLIKKPPSQERVAEDLIIAHVRGRLRYAPQRPLPRGEYQRLIDQVWGELAECGDLNDADPDKINNARILKAVRRGKKRKRPKG
jgi:hypothetical protein